MAPELGVLLLTEEESRRSRRRGLIPPRQAVGILLIFLLLLGGRLVRSRLLLAADGRWRDPLWLDHLLPQPDTAAAAEADRKQKPQLTSPLPINVCSVDSLTLLPGVGPVMAGRIAAARDTGLVFRSVADLRRIKGIGPKLSAKLAPHVLFALPAAADSATSAQSE